MLIIFDWNTVAKPIRTRRYADNVDQMEVYSVRTIPQATALREAGHDLAVIAWFAGVAFQSLPVSTEEATRMTQVAAGWIGAATWRMCPYNPKGNDPEFARDMHCTPPHPGMLIEVMDHLDYEPDDTIFVIRFEYHADMAESAGCDFVADVPFMTHEWETLLPGYYSEEG